MSKFLIVIDMQNDFVTGSLGSGDAILASSNIKKLLQKNEYDYIIFTQDTHYEDYLDTMEGKKLPVPHCIRGTEGWEIVPELAEEFGGSPFTIQKETFGYSHWKSKLIEYFNFSATEDTIDIVGVCTDICVVSNALILKALFPNTPIAVIQDCVAGTSISNNLAAITTMRACHIDIK